MGILQFLAPGINLKSFFNYFTSAEQLDETTLPPYETFFSTIKNCNVLEEEHTMFQEALQTLRLPTKPKTGSENYQWLQ